MSEATATGLPFRKFEHWHQDAVAYCPVCHSAEVRLVGTHTKVGGILLDVDENGAQVKNHYSSHAEAARGDVWQTGLHLRCGNGHNFHVWFVTDKSLTWAATLHENKSPIPPNKLSGPA